MDARIRMIWSFAAGAVGGAGVAAYLFSFAAQPVNPRTPAQLMVAAARSPGPLPGAGPPPGWHFVPNGVESCADKYGCARPSFDSDFWEWVAFGEQDCADEHGCARPRLPGKADATPVEKPNGPGKKGESQKLNRKAGPGRNREAGVPFLRGKNCVNAEAGGPSRWSPVLLRPPRHARPSKSSAQRARRMIPRYSRPEMTAIWAAQTRFRVWFEIEAHACDALAEIGVIPKEAAKAIWDKAGEVSFDVARIDAIEQITRHDVIAFLTHLAEFIGPQARFVHQGMTSSDLLDTCFAVQLTRASNILLADIDALLGALKRRAFEHKMTPMIGRSHGIHAEPMTFGLKLAQAYAEFARNRERLVQARKEIATCAISGAVGTYANIDPRVEAHVADKLGLAVEPASTQIIPRDRHAMFFATLGVIASSMERLATEIRHMQRTEVLEAEEFFAEGQKGSSAMPHKRNPVLTENITGLARLVRSMAMPAMENVALWHERDISHSSVERMIGPDATVTLDFALARLTQVIEKLVIYPKNMQKNLDRLGGLIHSQRVLLALTQKGVSREEAYALVQRNAMPVWRGEGDFLTLLKNDPQVRKVLDAAELEELFDLAYHLKHIDFIFGRLFGES